jgi:hypothetical protein
VRPRRSYLHLLPDADAKSEHDNGQVPLYGACLRHFTFLIDGAREETCMAERTTRPPRNRDLEQPRRTGETIQPAMPPERGQSERERSEPLPEEETYERETPKPAPGPKS